MSNASALLRSLIIYGLCLPLAVMLGYLLANPLDFTTVTVVVIILFTLTIPFLLRFHHAWLVATWNMSAVLFFLPGRPADWTDLAAISFTIAVLQYTINRNMKFLSVPSVTRPLLFIAVVVLITMRLTGGIGLRTFGSSSYGGRNYIGIFSAIIGYFALTSRRIPPPRAGLYVLLFLLGGATIAVGELARVLPAGFNFLYLVFPLLSNSGLAQQGTNVTGAVGGVMRVTGLGFLGSTVFAVMLARYGLRGIFLEPAKPWRAPLFLAMIFLSMFGGFRSIMILLLMTFATLFYLERLHQTRMLVVLIITMLLGGTLMTAFASRLPFALQRSIAFLPVDIDPAARMSAEVSSEWRLQMWRSLLPQVPQYLILGKGYTFSGREMAMIQDTTDRGGSGQESTMLAGDYHNGPLSVLMPFGIFGLAGFLWFVWAGLRVTYQNYQFGDPAYRCANAYFFAFYVVKTIFFFIIFGSFVSDLTAFAGLVGLSVSLNGGVAKPVLVAQPKAEFNRFRLHPSAQRPLSA